MVIHGHSRYAVGNKIAMNNSGLTPLRGHFFSRRGAEMQRAAQSFAVLEKKGSTRRRPERSLTPETAIAPHRNTLRSPLCLCASA